MLYVVILCCNYVINIYIYICYYVISKNKQKKQCTKKPIETNSCDPGVAISFYSAMIIFFNIFSIWCMCSYMYYIHAYIYVHWSALEIFWMMHTKYLCKLHNIFEIDLLGGNPAHGTGLQLDNHWCPSQPKLILGSISLCMPWLNLITFINNTKGSCKSVDWGQCCEEAQ